MHNTNGVADCRELLEINQERQLSQLKCFALKMYSTFGNTNVCESTFSTMKQVTSINRNRMADETLDDSLKLAPLTLVLITER